MIKSVLRISNLDFYELHIISEKVNKTVGNSRSLRIDSNLKANLDRKIYFYLTILFFPLLKNLKTLPFGFLRSNPQIKIRWKKQSILIN